MNITEKPWNYENTIFIKIIQNNTKLYNFICSMAHFKAHI